MADDVASCVVRICSSQMGSRLLPLRVLEVKDACLHRNGRIESVEW
eukprot:COSAG02_NODE_2504_length_8663_cov_3.628211_9_plen_46_part_00